MELAVRGKLLEQDTNDESVEILLKQITNERSKQEKAGSIKKSRSLPAISNTEGLFDIPENWLWVRLGTIAQILMGQSPPGNTYNKTGEGIALINGPVEFSDGPFGITVVNQYTTAPTNLCDEGDLLLCVRGSTTGRTNIAGFKACIGRGVAAIRPYFSDQYVRLFIWRQRASIIAMGRGIAFPSISKNQIEELEIPLPPLAEQHRIVAKVDELMALCDQLQAAQTEREQSRDRLVAVSLHSLNPSTDDEAANIPEVQREHARFIFNHLPRLTTRPTHIKQLRQTILDLAVRGKLVTQDPNDEASVVLLKKLLAEKSRMEKGGAIRKQQLLSALSSEEIPFELPALWEWQRLGNIGLTQTGTTPSSNNPEYFGDFIPFVKPANLTGNCIDYSGEGISEKGIQYSRLIPKHSALMVCIGSSIGKVNVTEKDVCCNQQINAVTPYIDQLTGFTSIALKATYVQKLVVANAGMGTLPIISKGKWEVLPVPVPPLTEQHRIVAKVDELMALCDQLGTQLTSTATDSRRLLEAVLHEALLPAPEQAA